MNKKILGMKLGKVLAGVICLAVALVIWMLVKYSLDANAALVMLNPVNLIRG